MAGTGKGWATPPHFFPMKSLLKTPFTLVNQQQMNNPLT